MPYYLRLCGETCVLTTTTVNLQDVKHFYVASLTIQSGIDSPVYQCKKAFLLNIAVNCSDTLLNISWMAVELPEQHIHKSEPNSAALAVQHNLLDCRVCGAAQKHRHNEVTKWL